MVFSSFAASASPLAPVAVAWIKDHLVFFTEPAFFYSPVPPRFFKVGAPSKAFIIPLPA
jgi:hypothetical protein